MNKNQIIIDGTTYVPLNSIHSTAKDIDGLTPVLIRSYAAGVHFGYLKTSTFTITGKVVTLIKSRRVWYWDGAASLSQMALEGVTKPETCKFSVELPEIEIANVIETIPLTEKALISLYNVAIWRK